jgi:hypothetical protein
MNGQSDWERYTSTISAVYPFKKFVSGVRASPMNSLPILLFVSLFTPDFQSSVSSVTFITLRTWLQSNLKNKRLEWVSLSPQMKFVSLKLKTVNILSWKAVICIMRVFVFINLDSQVSSVDVSNMNNLQLESVSNPRVFHHNNNNLLSCLLLSVVLFWETRRFGPRSLKEISSLFVLFFFDSVLHSVSIWYFSLPTKQVNFFLVLV